MNVLRFISPRHAATLCMFLLLDSVIQAQTTKLVVEPAATMPTFVDNRPALTEWMVSVQGPGLVEGRLELTVVANGQLLGSVLTDELVFNGVDQKIRVLLPPLNWPVGTDEILVKLRLHSKYGVIRLPQHRLRTSTTISRKFPMLIGETKQRPRSTTGRDKLADRLRFEAIFPEEFKDRAVTVMSHLQAGDFPQDPLTYCHYETILAADDVFVALRPPQLEGLLNWVRAGGSLYLEPKGILENGHVDFLNRLAADDPRNLVFTLDSKGHLPKDVFFADDEFLHLQSGLGTAVVGLPADINALAENQWQNVHATLWKIRDDQRADILANKVPSGLTANQFGDSDQGIPMDAMQWQMLASPAPSDTVYGMVDWLRPTGVRMVPLWVIASLLTTLVVLIGPVDFLTLTWLKRRKWTWITFPIAVVVMTGLTMWITNLYLSSAESRKAFVLHDVDRNGELLRTNRFELVFTSATRKLNSEVQSALFTPILTSGTTNDRFNGGAAARQQIRYVPGPNGNMVPTVVSNGYGGYGSEITSSEPVAVQGRVPSRYRVVQEVRQWTPQLNRTLSIGPTAAAAAIDWDALQIPDVPNRESLGQWNHAEFLSRVRRQFGESANYAVFYTEPGMSHDELVHSSDPRLAVRGNLYNPPRHGNRVSYSDPDVYEQEFALSQRALGVETMQAIMRLTSVPSQGLAALTTRTSPHGGRLLDDLSLHVTGAANRWWLVILASQGDDIVVYRKSDTYPR